jgi:hypothetical protein
MRRIAVTDGRHANASYVGGPAEQLCFKANAFDAACCPMSITMWSIALLATTSFSASFDLMDVSFYEALLLAGSER